MKKIFLFFALILFFAASCSKESSSGIPEPQSPYITSISPNIGMEETIVTLKGKRFSPIPSENIVRFAGIRAEVLTATDSLLTVKVPYGASTGIVTITVKNRTTNGPSFTYGKSETELDEDGNEIEYDYITTTYAGTPGVQGNVLGDKDQARFMLPNGVSYDPTTGDLIVADRSAHSIKRITKDGQVILIAGTGTSGRVDGPIETASFYNPYKTAVDKLGNIYVADNGNHRIRKIDLINGVVTTLAGGAGSNTSGYTDGIGTTALFNTVTGIAVDDDFNVYVADAANHCVRKISPDGRVATLSGIFGSPGIRDGVWPNVTNNRPTAVCMGKDGFLYVADRYGQRIRKTNVKTGETVTIAGSGGSAAGSGGHVDGEALKARFNNPWGIEIDRNGVIYITELEGTAGKNQCVRMLKNGQVSTIAGIPNLSDYGFVNGKQGESRFYNPTDVTVDDEGNIYIADMNNYVIRKIVKVKRQ